MTLSKSSLAIHRQCSPFPADSKVFLRLVWRYFARVGSDTVDGVVGLSNQFFTARLFFLGEFGHLKYLASARVEVPVAFELREIKIESMVDEMLQKGTIPLDDLNSFGLFRMLNGNIKRMAHEAGKRIEGGDPFAFL